MSDFLTTYKELEGTLKKVRGILSVKDYEDILTDTEIVDRLRLARNIRNYYCHHTDGEALVKVNKEMITFLNKEIEKVESSCLLVKDKYKSLSRSKYIINYGGIYDTIVLMKKNGITLGYVISDNGILLGELSLLDIMEELINGTSITQLKKKNIDKYINPTKISTVYKNMPLDNLSNGYYLVRDDKDTTKQKIIGELIIK